MSESKRPKDVLWLLWVTHRRLRSEVRGEHGGPARMWLVRLAVVWVAIGTCGGILWHGLTGLPVGLWLFVGSALVFRVARWYWRRLP